MMAGLSLCRSPLGALITILSLSPLEAQLTPKVEAWKNLGTLVHYSQYKVHVYYRDAIAPVRVIGSASKGLPLIVFLHGFPTSSYDWRKIIHRFPSYAVLTFDFLGFGLSDKPTDYEYTLSNHADQALELVGRYNRDGRPVFFVGHDMSTSICNEILAREYYKEPMPVQIVGALLFNGNMVMEKSSMVFGQMLLRSPLGFVFSWLQTKTVFQWQFARAVTPLPLSKAASWLELDDQWALIEYNGGSSLMHKLIQYTHERVEKAERLLGALRKSKVQISFAWALDDPVATAELQFKAWKKLRPGAPSYDLPELGHYPQMENPKAFAQVLLKVLPKS